ncbi:P-loop containing nucleoside triphosphate hydrolase protein [Thelephora terrestris]|nr:P-loop containing nucleoside triphosphate hydrolase protein [Thelephora terrestris]
MTSITPSPVTSTTKLQPPSFKPLEPSLTLLFSLMSRRDIICIFLPAVLASLISGGVAPFMTIAVGQAFDAFAKFPLTNPTQEDKDKLLRGVGLSALELLSLAVAALVLSSVTSSLWITTGEKNLRALRRRVYHVITNKEMVWFDKMGSDDSTTTADGEGSSIGAGGMMAQYAKDTEDVRSASSLALGLAIQYLTTTLVALILGFQGSWSLALVVLSTFPILVLLGGLSQGLSQGLLAGERSYTATAATLVDRAVASIATVKAFNAFDHELKVLERALTGIKTAAGKIITLWGVSMGFTQFFLMSMFVQAFWYGSKLVREGHNTPGQVMTVFWACLIATSNIHLATPQFLLLAKGKTAMASLLNMIEAPASEGSSRNSTHLIPLSRKVCSLRKIHPSECRGELEMIDVTFAYPSRPTVPILDNVTMYFPEGDTTFVIGGSGSGKSTVAQLLAGMYSQQSGQITLDQQDIQVLDEKFTRQHIALVSQSCIMFDMSVHDNVAMGLAGSPSGKRPEDVTREEVIAACRVALMHEFVRDLPDGYDTMLGNGGANLSGGQKQRLAVARAFLRDPTVLILDEATSALDATSRVLVFEAIKQWRKNKTTIVITHDISQIRSEDFVIVMKDGVNVETGYRDDLESMKGGYFRGMADSQGATHPERDINHEIAEKERKVQAILDETEGDKFEVTGPSVQPISLGNWMFDVVADLTVHNSGPSAVFPPRTSGIIENGTFAASPRSRRPSSVQVLPLAVPQPAAMSSPPRHRLSLQFSPTLPVFTIPSQASYILDDDDFDAEKDTIKKSASQASSRRSGRKRSKPELQAVIEESVPELPSAAAPVSIFKLLCDIYPTLPHKFFVFLGCFIAAASGAVTPVFSFVLSKLIVQVSAGAKDVSLINTLGGIVLALAAMDGLLLGLKYFILEKIAVSWVNRLRMSCFRLVLLQDKKWFDKVDGSNGPLKLVQIFIKDGDDARSFLATVIPQAIVVVTMIGTGLLWAMITGWQLTLVGMAIAPVFVVTMAIQTNLVAKCELRNKRAREQVAKEYYEAIANVRSIRAMAFERFFEQSFEKSIQDAHAAGIKGAFVEGCTHGVASSLIYFSEAALFYVGAIFIARGTYSYIQMVEVLNLIVFTVSLGSQLMGFTQHIATSLQATRDFHRLMQLSTNTQESQGSACPPIRGSIRLNKVSFTYPERPEAPVLKNVSMEVREGECVAIVGASGCGKSTIAALLQRLYEPTSGSITIGPNKLGSINVGYLRDHVAVVSQNPNLFDAPISENIAYGSQTLPQAQIEEAAKSAQVHDFIMSLPKGYKTLVGENASLISGGQAQRIQIARALVRPANVLILDECTSALDPTNQAAVLETIKDAKLGRTTVMVTHKIPAMKMCDRILVVHDGAIAETGTFDELMDRKGVFAQLASGGEWFSD